MKKHIILLGALALSSLAYDQVRINTEIPKATLDIAARPNDNTKTDRIIVPRLTREQLRAKDSNYDTDQHGAVVFVTEGLEENRTTLKTLFVLEPGFYYYDALIQRWVNLPSKFVLPTEPWHIQASNPSVPSLQAKLPIIPKIFIKWVQLPLVKMRYPILK